MRFVLGVAGALGLFASQARGQTLYQWVDPNGNVHYSETPPPGYREIVPTRKPTADAGTPPAATQAETAKPVEATPAMAKAAPTPQNGRFEVSYLGREGRAERVIVRAQLNGRVTAPMLLDTGSPRTMLSLSLARKLDLFSRNEGNLLVATGGIGGATPAIRTILDSVAVGEAAMRFVPVTVIKDLSDAFEGLIGMDFLSHYEMTIDRNRNLVILVEQRLDADAPGGHPESWWRDNFAEFRTLRDTWRDLLQTFRTEMERSALSANSRDPRARRFALASFQYREAGRLYDRLERYASTQ